MKSRTALENRSILENILKGYGDNVSETHPRVSYEIRHGQLDAEKRFEYLAYDIKTPDETIALLEVDYSPTATLMGVVRIFIPESANCEFASALEYSEVLSSAFGSPKVQVLLDSLQRWDS